MNTEYDPISMFQLEVMRVRDNDAEMLEQIEAKKGAELVAFVSDWWGTRSHQILLEMVEAGNLDQKACRQVSEHLKSQEQVSWRDLSPEWRRQFGIKLEC
jgi:hypothetical protein